MPAPQPRLTIRYAVRSDAGREHETNEDQAYAGPRLLAVADGVSAPGGGDIASTVAIEALKQLDTDIPASELLGALEYAVNVASVRLDEIAETVPALSDMGTTLTAMLWSGSQIAVVNIGDSRGYLLRGGHLFQITHDHSVVQALIDEGQVSPEESLTHPQRSLLLRAIRAGVEAEPDISLYQAHEGDRYLLCSDGLSGVVSAPDLHAALAEAQDPQQAVKKLVDLAYEAGAPDNVTCVVADVLLADG